MPKRPAGIEGGKSSAPALTRGQPIRRQLALQKIARAAQARRRRPQSMQLIDASIVRAHQHAAAEKRGSGSRHWPFSWRPSKIHAVVDERGLPVRLALSAGQASDKASAPMLLAGLPAVSVVVADRGYDWQHLIDLITQRGGQAHIPTQRDR